MKLRPQHAILGAMALVAVIALSVAVLSTEDQPGTSKADGSVITYRAAEGTGDASIDLPITLQEGGDAAHESEHVFERVATIPGAIEADFDTTTLVLTISYDSAVTDGAAVRQEMYLAGYTALAREDATPAELADGGSVQRISVSADGGLAPRFIVAKAGLPLEMIFSAGTECLTTIRLPELEVTQDISAGGTVSLPALEPGSYALVCGQDALEGTLIVE